MPRVETFDDCLSLRVWLETELLLSRLLANSPSVKISLIPIKIDFC